jgi:hypothetical protein
MAGDKEIVLEYQTVTVALRGTRPLIMNAFSDRAKQSLLISQRRLTAAERAGTPKHDVLAEFRDSVYLADEEEEGPTAIVMPSGAFKSALMTAALDLPGTYKARVGRLVMLPGDWVPIWGIPELRMDVVRSADMKRTPDVRTRAVFRRWATELTLHYATPLLTLDDVARLLHAAGMTVGVGDFRPEKGKGTYGQFAPTEPDNEDYLRAQAEGGAAAQLEALANPRPYDRSSARLLAWWIEKAAK